MEEKIKIEDSCYSYMPDEKPYVILAILGSLIGFIPPFIVYIMKKDALSEGAVKYIADVLNFELVMLIVCAVLFALNIIPILGTLLCGLLFPLVVLFNSIVIILATLAAVDKRAFRYLFSYKFI